MDAEPFIEVITPKYFVISKDYIKTVMLLRLIIPIALEQLSELKPLLTRCTIRYSWSSSIVIADNPVRRIIYTVPNVIQ